MMAKEKDRGIKEKKMKTKKMKECIKLQNN